MEDIKFTPQNVTPELIWLADHILDMRYTQIRFFNNPTVELFTERRTKELSIDKALVDIMKIASLDLVDG